MHSIHVRGQAPPHHLHLSRPVHRSHPRPSAHAENPQGRTRRLHADGGKLRERDRDVAEDARGECDGAGCTVTARAAVALERCKEDEKVCEVRRGWIGNGKRYTYERKNFQ